MRKPLAALAALLPVLALPQGIVPSGITTARISRSSAAHYVQIQSPPFTPTAGTSQFNARVVYPFAAGARLVDVIVYQVGAGTGGTSIAVDVQNSAGTSLLTTTAVATLASGGHQKTDALGAIALPSGWTRPVLKTDTTLDVTKGAVLQINTVETGTYSPHPTLLVVLVFEPKQ